MINNQWSLVIFSRSASALEPVLDWQFSRGAAILPDYISSYISLRQEVNSYCGVNSHWRCFLYTYGFPLVNKEYTDKTEKRFSTIQGVKKK